MIRISLIPSDERNPEVHIYLRSLFLLHLPLVQDYSSFALIITVFLSIGWPFPITEFGTRKSLSHCLIARKGIEIHSAKVIIEFDSTYNQSHNLA
ncbi:hypothetical protein P8452_40661 [Trifolium repens]|nr:hypothetical protein P8452_40661 [Trifolium repens]